MSDIETTRRVTAQMKVTKPDGRVIVEDVELDEQSIAAIVADAERRSHG